MFSIILSLHIFYFILVSGGSGSLSPSTSFDKSVKSLENIVKSDELNTIEVPPALPMKSKTLPVRSVSNNYSSIEEIDLHGNSLLDISHPSSINDSSKSEKNTEVVPTTLANDVLNNEVLDKLEMSSTVPDKLQIATIIPDKLQISSTVPDKLPISSTVPDKLQISSTVPDKLQISSTVPDKIPLPSTAKTFPNLEALKPPPLEKRQTPSTIAVDRTRTLPTNITTAVPRPKPGQVKYFHRFFVSPF